jgi:hypothetical protein
LDTDPHGMLTDDLALEPVSWGAQKAKGGAATAVTAW